MSLFFLLNNFHFALELVGALVFLMVAWLLFDAYVIGRNASVLLRSIGLVFLAGWQLIHGFTLSGDLINYAGGLIYLLGLLLVIIGFLSEPKPLQIKSIIVLPAFAALAAPFYAAASAGLFIIALLAFRRYKADYNKTLIPFWTGFLLLASAAVTSIFYKGSPINFFWLVGHGLEIGGFLSLTWWVWQYIRLRIKESMILIFVSMTFFIATVVTLAFSTIFVAKIESTTKANLLTNVKVLDYAISRLKEEAFAKAQFIAQQPDLRDALAKNDFSVLERAATNYLERERLGFLTIIDENSNVVLRAHALTQKEDNASGERAVQEALKGNPFITIETSPAEKFSIRAAAPIFIDNNVKGAIVAGFLLDNAMVDGIKRITSLEMSVLDGDILIATTVLNPDGRTRSVGIRETNTEIKDAVLTKGEEATLRIEILSRPFLASYLPLRDSDNKIIGMISAGKPQQEILEIANATNRLTFITVALIMLVLIAPMYFITNRLIIGAI